MVQRMMFVSVVLILGTMRTVVLGGNELSTDANAPQTLSEYLRYGALHNAGLKAAFEEWKAALEQIPQAKALLDPRFTYGFFIEAVETRVGPQRQRFSLLQTFPWFGKIAARTDVAAAAAKAAQQRYEGRKLRLF
jgi:cobalt-zinc-cadmium efflux system outer membrane protein